MKTKNLDLKIAMVLGLLLHGFMAFGQQVTPGGSVPPYLIKTTDTRDTAELGQMLGVIDYEDGDSLVGYVPVIYRNGLLIVDGDTLASNEKEIKAFGLTESTQVDTLRITLADGSTKTVIKPKDIVLSNAAPVGAAIAKSWIDTLGTEDTMYVNNNGVWDILFGGGSGSNYTSGQNIDITNDTISVTDNIVLQNTTGSSNTGILFKGSNRFLHNFNYGNNGIVTTQGQNTFLGELSGNFTMGSTATNVSEASGNTGGGYQSLNKLTTGSNNASIGLGSLQFLETGYENSAFGVRAGQLNISGYRNLYAGYQAGRSNTAYNNVFLGYQSGLSVGSGYENSMVGTHSLSNGGTSFQNAGIGLGVLFNCTDCQRNVALGMYAGRFIGDDATPNSTAYQSIFLGYRTHPLLSGQTNQVVIGHEATGEGDSTAVIGKNLKTLRLGDNMRFKMDRPYGAADDNFVLTYNHATATIDLEAPSGSSISGLTTNYVTKATSPSTIGDSQIFDNGVSVGIGTATPTAANKVEIVGNTSTTTLNSLKVYRGGGNLASNTAIGTASLTATTTGANNTAIGNGTLILNTTGANNTAIGVSALNKSVTASNNTAIGYQSMLNDTSGINNTAIGYLSLTANSSGNSNTAIGSQALTANTTGRELAGIGYRALVANTTGIGSVGIGYASGNSNTTGNYNTYLGWESAFSANGSENVAIGMRAGRFEANGSTANSAMSNSVIIGARARVNASSQTNQIVIGANTIGIGTNTAVIGDGNITKHKFNRIVLNSDQTLGAAQDGFVMTYNNTSGEVEAQDAKLTYFTQDGNSFGAPAVIGTNDAQPFEIKTGGTTRATFLSTGAASFAMPDNNAAGFAIGEGATSYFNIATTNSAEAVTLGNASTRVTVNLKDNTDEVFTVQEGANVYLQASTLNGSELVYVPKKLTTDGGINRGTWLSISNTSDSLNLATDYLVKLSATSATTQLYLPYNPSTGDECVVFVADDTHSDPLIFANGKQIANPATGTLVTLFTTAGRYKRYTLTYDASLGTAGAWTMSD